jgi:hypothetical protein
MIFHDFWLQKVMMFDMEYPAKSKVPSNPKPSGTAKRPVLGRKRDTAKTSKEAMGCSFHDG